MTQAPEFDTDTLIRKARQGDSVARGELLTRHRSRLRHLVAYRLDPRLAARIDPSDVVQEALADASRRLSDYLEHQPLPYYPWLRQLALEKLLKLHRRHITAQKRSVTREEELIPPLPDESALELAGHIMARSQPLGHLLRMELRQRVQAVLARLAPRDREVLVLRHVEQMSGRDMAAVLGVSPGAVRVRHLRALQRFQYLLGQESGDSRKGENLS
ncbi:MAG TPA: sigma-70 family RNA polymerase sigma factor [Gemmataceae bacterium]|jgi:RNA polymerase sigma-70 factor (ECF subfamily)|nr:sigma-70 family RNA polymerase sigma factor [Gemmataceae bacterium]